MNAEDKKKLDELWYADKTTRDKLREAYALGRLAGMTEAAGICQKVAMDDRAILFLAAAIEKARDA